MRERQHVCDMPRWLRIAWEWDSYKLEERYDRARHAFLRDPSADAWGELNAANDELSRVREVRDV